jgi:YesN/AraC family two-component response regulator
MSAYKEFDYAVEALNAGAEYFMRKPIDPDELNSVIDKIF